MRTRRSAGSVASHHRIARRVLSFKELSVGDYVVHEGHGVGIYRGIENVEVDGVAKDYIKIEWQAGSLYILTLTLI